MNINIKNILIVVAAIVVGLGIGYFIFGGNNMEMPAENHGHSEMENRDDEQIWTCSMHPQIRQNEPGICPICEMDLIKLESNVSDDPLVLQMTETAVKLAQIETTIVGLGMAASGTVIPLIGKVQADERRASSQVAHVPGRIEKLFVSFTGEQVNKGQKLATLYSPELITAQRELLEAAKLKATNPSLVEAARNKLRFWKIGEETIREIEEKGEVRETFNLYASESGVVTKRRVAVGDYVKKGEPLFVLVNLGKVWVLFDAYEEDLPQVSVGDRVEFSTLGIPGKTFESRITFIDPVINPQTRTASLRTEVSNPRGRLKPEMLVEGKLAKNAGKKTKLTVPKSTVLWTGERSVVYVKIPDMEIPSFQFREVKLGESTSGAYQVLEGLEAGEEVVTHGNFSIDAAAQLNNQASMMNRDVKLKKESRGTPDFRDETPEAFQKQLNVLVINYLNLKNALVETDAPTAAEAAKEVLEKLGMVEMSLLKGDAHRYWMEQLSALESHGKKMAESSDINEQRRQFSFFSNALIKAVTAFGTSNEALYVQYCPMAMDNEGADWLSSEAEIRNPYFGDKMLTCGTVKREISNSSQ